MNNKLVSFIVAVPILFSACTWVKVSEQAENIRVISEEEAANCKQIGKATTNLLDKVVGISRNKEKMQSEMEILARNQAAELGGDAVRALTEIEEGKQTFAVYQCGQ